VCLNNPLISYMVITLNMKEFCPLVARYLFCYIQYKVIKLILFISDVKGVDIFGVKEILVIYIK